MPGSADMPRTFDPPDFPVSLSQALLDSNNEFLIERLRSIRN